MSGELQTVATSGMPMELTPKQVTDQVQLIQQVMRDAMKDGEHYGKIPGCGEKPALLKAGAEKLSLTFRLAPSYKIERLDLPNGHREYIIICELRHIETGKLLGAGVGSCSTMESKYRWRNADAFEVTDLAIPRDSKEKKSEYRKQGFGMKKIDNEWKWVRFTGDGSRVENPDIADQYNTVLKMGKKRAQVDATLTALAASDIFTQDIEERLEDAQHVSATVVESQPLQLENKPQEITEAEQTNARKWRAVVNKKGSECKDLQQIQDAIIGFEKTLGAYFDGPTYHKEEETFRSLLMSHSQRIEERGPEAVKAWIGELEKVQKGQDMAGFVTAFTTSDWLKNTECEDALSAKATELGFESLDAAIEALVRKA